MITLYLSMVFVKLNQIFFRYTIIANGSTKKPQKPAVFQ